MIAFITSINASSQTDRVLSDYFPEKQDPNRIVDSRHLFSLNFTNPLDTVVALRYFFDNDSRNMHFMYEAFNMDDNTYTLVPYIRIVYLLYRIKKQDVYLLAYGLENHIYIAIFDYRSGRIENTFIVVSDSDFADTSRRSTIFPNGHIVTVELSERAYYILTKIDYSSRRFIELKRIEADGNQSDRRLMDSAFEALGISREGDLLQPNQ